MDFEREMRSRLRRLEQNVDFLLSVNPLLAEVMTLLKQNNKAGAITFYREKMGVSPTEAKEAVEKLASER